MQVSRHRRSPNAAAVVAVLAAVAVAAMGLGLATCCPERVRLFGVESPERNLTPAKTPTGSGLGSAPGHRSPGHDHSHIRTLTLLTYNVNYQRRRSFARAAAR